MVFKKGNKHSDETKKKISIALKGNRNVYGFTKEQRMKANKNLKSYNQHQEETKKRIRKSWFKKGHQPLIFGENHHRWKGGISFEPYGKEFNNQLKSQIRERDNHTCQNCNGKSDNEKLCIHHIDENKSNNSSDNLISLCRECHMTIHGR
jgi:hypothetical protein